jgi:hypothetical protein
VVGVGASRWPGVTARQDLATRGRPAGGERSRWSRRGSLAAAGLAAAAAGALLTAHAMCSADAGSRSSRHRRRSFPQARGESPPRGRALARQAARRGKGVAVLPPRAYGGHKDANEAWAAGVLAVGGGPRAGDGSERRDLPEDFREAWNERVAIIVVDSGVPHAEAERVALVALQAQPAARGGDFGGAGLALGLGAGGARSGLRAGR